MLLLGVAALMLGCHPSTDYGLPIAPGASATRVHLVLGVPTESFKSSANDRVTTEWYYKDGIVATFEDGQLKAILLLNFNVGNLFDYPGFSPCSTEIIRRVRLTDSKQTILYKLGEPTKSETNDLPAGTDADVPVLWPKESHYYWRLTNYAVGATFLNQAQRLSDEVTLPKDAPIAISITK